MRGNIARSAIGVVVCAAFIIVYLWTSLTRGKERASTRADSTANTETNDVSILAAVSHRSSSTEVQTEGVRSRLDEDGSESVVSLAPTWIMANGKLDLLITESSGDAQHIVFAESAEWRGRLPAGMWRVRAASQDGVSLAFRADVLSRQSSRARVEITGVNCLRIEAYDATTGAPIRQVVVSALDSGGEKIQLHDCGGNEPSSVAALDVTEIEEGEVLLCESEHYCPTKLARRKFDRILRVPMQLASSLGVTVIGSSLQPRSGSARYLCVEQNGIGSMATVHSRTEMPLAIGHEVLIGNLPVAAHTVSLRERASVGPGVVLAAVDVQVVAGRVEHIQIPLPNDEMPACDVSVAVSGATVDEALLRSFQIDAARWVDNRWTRIALERPRRWTELATGTAYSFRMGVFEPGRYKFSLLPIAVESELELMPGESVTVPFDISDVAVVAVTMSGASERNSVTALAWGYEDGLNRLGGLSYLPQDAETILHCVARPIWVQAFGDIACSRKAFCSPTAGTSVGVNLLLDRPRAPSIDVVVEPPEEVIADEFWSTVTTTPLDGGQCLALTLPDSDGKGNYLRQSTARARVLVTSNGRYRVEYGSASGARESEIVTVGGDTAILQIQFGAH